MKIVQIGPFPLDATCIKGGVEASVYGLATELAKNHILTVIDVPRTDLHQDKIDCVDGITIFRFTSPGKSNTSALFRSKKIIETIRVQRPDICHIHTSSLFSFLLFIALKFYKIPSIVTIHGLAHIEKQHVWHKQRNLINFVKYITQSITEFLFISLCRILIVDTPYVAETIELYKKQHKIFCLPDCKVIPQGINPVFFQLANSSKNSQLLSVGALSKRKGHLHLIEAMKKVKQQFPDFFLSIIGSISETKYLEFMQVRIKETGMEKNIRVFPNAPFEQILTFYSEAEIFVLHSEEESQGIVFCEAMAAGKPIVATKAGGVPWVVENNVNGLLSNYGDIDTFANHVISLLKDENLRKKIEDTNRIQSHKYDWKIIADEIVEVYKKLIINH
ncbi:MAG: glycosyltransferase family 4 protein [Bacteroidota bacterium]|nr:glycosyltransferase family 4 protein [Bacteroidota bacterium]